MIGLKRGSVELSAHDADWGRAAQETIAELAGVFGGKAVGIEHIGSTAIRGISAKPIIDIAVGVRSLEGLEAECAGLERAGFRRSVNRFSSNLLFVREHMQGGAAVRTHQIHILVYGCEQWHNYVDFRDHMNAFPEKAREYEALKERLRETCGGVQRAYTDGKAEYMKKALAEARAWASQKG